MALADAVAYCTVHYNLDEASGTRADSIGSKDLTDNGSVGSGTGLVSGNSADFESSSSQYLEHADDAVFDLGDRDWMYFFTIQAESFPSFAVAFRKGTSGVGNVYACYYDSSLTWDVNGTTAAWGSALSTATKYLVHVWHDATNNQIGIAINAGTAVTTSYSGGVANETGTFQIGASSNQNLYWDGLIDDFGLLDGYILNATERTEHYNSGSIVPFADWAGGGGGASAPMAIFRRPMRFFRQMR